MCEKSNNKILSFLFLMLFSWLINVFIQYVLFSWIILIVILLFNIITIIWCSNGSNLYYLFQITWSYLFIYLPFCKKFLNLNKWDLIYNNYSFEYVIQFNDFINMNYHISLYIIFLCLCYFIMRYILNSMYFSNEIAYKSNYIYIVKRYIKKCIYILFTIVCTTNLLLIFMWYILWILDLDYWVLNLDISWLGKYIKIEYSNRYIIDCYSILWEYIRINTNVDIPMNSNIMDSLMQQRCKTLTEINDNCTKNYICLCEAEGELIFNNLNNELLNINSPSLLYKKSNKQEIIILFYITTLLLLFLLVNKQIPDTPTKEQDWWENGYPDLETIISYLW